MRVCLTHFVNDCSLFHSITVDEKRIFEITMFSMKKSNLYFWCGVVVITTAQLHSSKLELSFCAGSNPACGMSEIRDGEDL